MSNSRNEITSKNDSFFFLIVKTLVVSSINMAEWLWCPKTNKYECTEGLNSSLNKPVLTKCRDWLKLIFKNRKEVAAGGTTKIHENQDIGTCIYVSQIGEPEE